MKNRNLNEISSKLDVVSQFVRLRRKKIASEIKALLGKVDSELSVLDRKVKKLKNEKKILIDIENKYKHKIEQLQSEINDSIGINKKMSRKIDVLQKNIRNLNSLKKDQEREMGLLQKEIADLSTIKRTHEEEIERLCKEAEKLSGTQKKLEQKHEELAKLYTLREKKFSALQGDYDFVANRFKLVSSILSAKPCINEALEKFKELLHGEFMDFANEESSLAEEAKAILMLQSIEKDMELIARFPGIFNKNIFAVGGGFSSGKSAFANSFIEQTDIRLPIGMKPVTAIPTYVIADNKCTISCYSEDGGRVDISEELFKKLSHDYIKSFDFNLKKIMPFMTLCCRLPGKYFENICLIDTPGYNPAAADAFIEEDRQTSIEYLERANTLLWMIGMDSQGTMPASDLAFLSELDLSDKKMFVIANKADLRAQSELEDIISEIEGALDDYDIEYCGISAYSAKRSKEYLFRRQSLLDFMENENSPVLVQAKIKKRIETVFNMYDSAINENIKKAREIKSDIKSLDLDLLETGFEFDNEKIQKRLDGLVHFYDINKLKGQLKTLGELGKKMVALVDNFFDCIGN